MSQVLTACKIRQANLPRAEEQQRGQHPAPIESRWADALGRDDDLTRRREHMRHQNPKQSPDRPDLHPGTVGHLGKHVAIRESRIATNPTKEKGDMQLEVGCEMTPAVPPRLPRLS